MTDLAPGSTEAPHRIRLTRNQIRGGFVVVAAMALFSGLGISAYGSFVVNGPSIPERAALELVEGRLAALKRSGGKTKRKDLLIEIEGDGRTFIFGSLIGDVDSVEQRLSEMTGDVGVRIDPESHDIYELARGGRTVRAYDEIAARYRKGRASHAHVKGVLSMVLLGLTILLAVVLVHHRSERARREG